MRKIRGRLVRQRGTTLIELMTAIFIISLLASIIVPVYRRSVYRAEYSACQCNLRNIVTAVQEYHTENKTYPPTLGELLPRGYLNSLPECPSAGFDSYSGGYEFNNVSGEFTLSCSGSNHAAIGFGANEPYYTFSSGLGP